MLDNTIIKEHENGYTVKIIWLYDFFISFGNKVTIVRPKSVHKTLQANMKLQEIIIKH